MAVVTTNLASQVQNRINNLTGNETLDQLLVLRKAADNLSLSLTAIEAAISAKIAALDGSSPDDDLLIANRAASLVGGNSQESPIKSIQRGRVMLSSVPTVTVTISEININSSVLILNGLFSQSFGGNSKNDLLVGVSGRITSGTTIEFTSGYISQNNQVDWQVIEYV